jgi:hypothetical protein
MVREWKGDRSWRQRYLVRMHPGERVIPDALSAAVLGSMGW